MICVQCKLQKESSGFRPKRKICLVCEKNNRQEARTTRLKSGDVSYATMRNAQNRLDVLNHYSGGDPKCACCGENQIGFLSIDHIGGGGSAHRKKLDKAYGRNFHQWIKNHNYPIGFRVLCFNCNLADGIHGVCPHTLTPDEIDRIPQFRRVIPRELSLTERLLECVSVTPKTVRQVSQELGQKPYIVQGTFTRCRLMGRVVVVQPSRKRGKLWLKVESGGKPPSQHWRET